MARRRKPHDHELPQETRAALERIAEARARVERLLPAKAGCIDNDAILAKLAAAGLSNVELEKLRAKLAKAAVEPKRQARAEQRLREIRRLNAEGLHDGVIAAQLGLTRAYVCQVRGANGIPAVRRKP